MLFLVTDGRKLRAMLDEFVVLPIDWIFTPKVFVAKHGFLENQLLGLAGKSFITYLHGDSKDP